MSKVISSFSAVTLLTGALAVMLALGTGYVLPHGELLLYSSASNWQDEVVHVYALDRTHDIAKPLFISRSDDLPGLPIVWSPDGKRAAYVLESQPPQTRLLDIQTMQIQSLAGALTDSEFDAEWSPDGRTLAYVGVHDGESDLYVADADGSHPRPLTATGAGYKNLAWSPDSSRIAVEVGQMNEDIALINVADGRVTPIAHDTARDIRPAWSPDGVQIAFMSSRDNVGTGGTRFDLYRVEAVCDGCPARRLTDTYPADSTWEIRWSPDGQHALFGSTSWSGGDDIYLVDARSAQNITHDAAIDASPVWSPDGSQFAYEARQDGIWTIVLANADGRERRKLVEAPYDERRPVWSPDGSEIAFIADPPRNWDVYVMNVTNSSVPIRRLTYSANIDFSPMWQPFSGENVISDFGRK